MPLAWVGLGFILGLLVGHAHPMPWASVGLLLIALFGGYCLARAASLRIGGAALLLAGALLGVWRADAVLLDDAGLHEHHGSSIMVTGVVSGVAETVGTRLRFTLDATSIDQPGDEQVPVAAQVIAWVTQNPGRSPLIHGDQVTVRGELGAPEVIGVFDYPEHLAARGIHDVMARGQIVSVERGESPGAMRLVHGWRRSLAESARRHVPEPQASVVNALTLGLRGGLPPETSAAFRDSGLSHLLAVSGLHVGVLLTMVLGASARLIGRHRVIYLLPPLVLLWAYVLLAGAPPSALRAGLMGTAVLLALATGRASAPGNALGLTVLLMLSLDPAALWDRAFQLSAAAMAGVLFIGLPVARRAFALGESSGPWIGFGMTYLIAPLLVSLGAVVGSMPLVAFNFGQVPLLSIPATLVAMPLMAPLLVFGLLTGLAGLSLGVLASPIGLIPAALGGLLVAVADATAAVPGTIVETEIEVRWVWISYACLALVVAVAYRTRWWTNASDLARAIWRGPARRSTTIAMLAAFAVAAAWPWAALAFDEGDGRLHVYFLDVGQGDATLIVGPSGQSVLIDGGRDPRVTINAIDAVLADGESVLDLAVLTHPDADHANGVLELASRQRFNAIITGPAVDEAGAQVLAVLGQAGMMATTAVGGMEVALGDGLVLDILYPPDPPVRGTGADVNNNSVAAMLRWGEASVLFTGDLHTQGEEVLLSLGADVDADVLQVGHHGSATSSTNAFLDAVTPTIAVISAGEGNPFGHPAAQVVERLTVYTAEDGVLNTAEVGMVELYTEGNDWFRVGGSP